MFNYIEDYTIITRTFIYKNRNNASFSSFIETGLSGGIVLNFSRYSRSFNFFSKFWTNFCEKRLIITFTFAN